MTDKAPEPTPEFLRRQRYDALKAVLTVDLLRIDQELASMPQRVQEAAELAAESQGEEHAARHALDITVAGALGRLREVGPGEKAKSEARVESEMALEPDVMAARDAYDAARLDHSRCDALYKSMRAKSEAISDACRMVVGGYITPSSYSRGRSQLAPRPPTEGAAR